MTPPIQINRINMEEKKHRNNQVLITNIVSIMAELRLLGVPASLKSVTLWISHGRKLGTLPVSYLPVARSYWFLSSCVSIISFLAQKKSLIQAWSPIQAFWLKKGLIQAWSLIQAFWLKKKASFRLEASFRLSGSKKSLIQAFFQILKSLKNYTWKMGIRVREKDISRCK